MSESDQAIQAYADTVQKYHDWVVRRVLRANEASGPDEELSRYRELLGDIQEDGKLMQFAEALSLGPPEITSRAPSALTLGQRLTLFFVRMAELDDKVATFDARIAHLEAKELERELYARALAKTSEDSI